MKKITSILTIGILTILTSFQLSSQRSNALILQLGHQDDLIPLKITSLEPSHTISIRPLITAGLQHSWYEGRRFRFYQDAIVSYHIHPYIERSLALGTDIGLEWRLFGKVIFNPKVGYSFARANYKDPQYAYESNKWVPTDNSTAPSYRHSIKLGLEVGYGLTDKIDIVAGGQLNTWTNYLENVVSVYPYKGAYLGFRGFF